MPRRNDGDNRYDAYLDMREANEANEEYEYDEYVGECQDMDGEPYDVFIDIFDEEAEAEGAMNMQIIMMREFNGLHGHPQQMHMNVDSC